MDKIATYWPVISTVGMLIVGAFTFWLRQTTVSRRRHETAINQLAKEIDVAHETARQAGRRAQKLELQIETVATREDIHHLQLEIVKVNGNLSTLQATFEGFAESMKGFQNITNLQVEKALKGTGS